MVAALRERGVRGKERGEGQERQKNRGWRMAALRERGEGRKERGDVMFGSISPGLKSTLRDSNPKRSGVLLVGLAISP